MEKKTISVQAFTVHMYTIIIVVLVALLAFVGLKYLHLKFAVENFTEGAMLLNASQPATGPISDYAELIATTVADYPQGGALITQPLQLQNYTVTLSKTLGRDIVIVDMSRKILADTIAANVGTNYSYDQNKEIDQTLKDGASRSFVEKSTDYPEGITETIAPIHDISNRIIGVVLISNTTISNSK